jgi:hypothetical protein
MDRSIALQGRLWRLLSTKRAELGLEAVGPRLGRGFAVLRRRARGTEASRAMAAGQSPPSINCFFGRDVRHAARGRRSAATVPLDPRCGGARFAGPRGACSGSRTPRPCSREPATAAPRRITIAYDPTPLPRDRRPCRARAKPHATAIAWPTNEHAVVVCAVRGRSWISKERSWGAPQIPHCLTCGNDTERKSPSAIRIVRKPRVHIAHGMLCEPWPPHST